MLDTYEAEEELAVEQRAHAADEGAQKEEAAAGHAEVAGPVVALDGQIFRVDPEARVAAHVERHCEQHGAEREADKVEPEEDMFEKLELARTAAALHLEASFSKSGQTGACVFILQVFVCVGCFVLMSRAAASRGSKCGQARCGGAACALISLWFSPSPKRVASQKFGSSTVPVGLKPLLGFGEAPAPVVAAAAAAAQWQSGRQRAPMFVRRSLIHSPAKAISARGSFARAAPQQEPQQRQVVVGKQTPD